MYEHIAYELLEYDLDQIFEGTDHTDEECYYHVSPGYVLVEGYNHQKFFHNVDTVYVHISLEVLVLEWPKVKIRDGLEIVLSSFLLISFR